MAVTDVSATTNKIHEKNHPHGEHEFTGISVVLAADGSGNASEIDYDESATATTIPIRDSNGDLIVPSTPTAANAAAGKDYVDAQVAGARDIKEDVKAGTDSALPAYTRSGNVLTADANGAFPTVDGVTISSDGTAGANDGTEDGSDAILLKDGAAGADNGLYFLSDPGDASNPWKLTRRSDADSDVDVTAGLYLWVSEGTVNGDKGFLLTTNDPITLNTTSLTFSKVSGLGQVTAGAGLSKSGDTLTVGDPDKGIQVNADDLEFSASEVAESGKGLKAGTGSYQLAVEPTDFAGSGLEDDGSDNLRIAASAAGTGLNGGGGSALSVEARLDSVKADVTYAGASPTYSELNAVATAVGDKVFARKNSASTFLCFRNSTAGGDLTDFNSIELTAMA